MQFTNSVPHSLIQPLGSRTLDLNNAGGKGANLARLIQTGFHVTGGFVVLTQAYRDHIQQNNFAQAIQSELARLEAAGPEQLDACAAAIQGFFKQADLSDELKAEILSQPSAAQDDTSRCTLKLKEPFEKAQGSLHKTTTTEFMLWWWFYAHELINI